MIKPSVVIKRHNGEPYLRRWHLIPRNRFFNVYLHHFVGSDDERALHDHPWASLSFLLRGTLREAYFDETDREEAEQYGNNYAFSWWRVRWMRPVYRRAKFSHRLIVMPGETAWTLFLTGPRIRAWGFWCPGGWKYWRDYESDGGCDA